MEICERWWTVLGCIAALLLCGCSVADTSADDDAISQPPSGFTAIDAGGYLLLPPDSPESSDVLTPYPADGGAGGTDAGGQAGERDDDAEPAQERTSTPGRGFAKVDTASGVEPVSCGTTIYAVVRDFHADGVDFEGVVTGSEPGLVDERLGPDRKPVFLPTGATATISSPESFNGWYRNVEGVNDTFVLEMFFGEAKDGTLSFYGNEFFPVDGAGFGAEGFAHNYHFTTEIHTQFFYSSGQRFGITGDDDVWIFVNGWLVADMGGTHESLSAEVDMDAVAERLGMQVGHVYPFEMFHAERHSVGSVFRADTNLKFVDCGALFPGDKP